MWSGAKRWFAAALVGAAVAGAAWGPGSSAARAQDSVVGDLSPVTAHAVAPPSAAEREERRTSLHSALASSMRGLDRKTSRANGVVTTRDLANGALAHLILDGAGPHAGAAHAETALDARADALLQQELATEQMDHTAPGYGKLPWQTGPKAIDDDNSIEFGTQAWGPILLRYSDRLTPETRLALTEHARAAFSALRRHGVKPSYTNIFLMKTVCLILLGEAVGDNRAAGDGYQMLDQWVMYTRQSGIREFDSPTYYSTSMNSLLNGYRFARRPGARGRFAAALNLFWTDIAAHYFAGRQDLSGPHSRDYDFLQGDGGVNLSLYAEGLKDYGRLTSIDLEKVYLVLNLEDGGYRPPSSVYALAARPQRTVVQRWDDGIGQSSYTFITREFSLGSTSTAYGPQDKPVNLELASLPAPGSASGIGPQMPEITVVGDDSDSPYGKHEERDRSGHNKPNHLPLNPVAVQERGALLLLTTVNARRPTPTPPPDLALPAGTPGAPVMPPTTPPAASPAVPESGPQVVPTTPADPNTATPAVSTTVPPATASADAALDAPTSLATNVILPARVDAITVNGAPLDVDTAQPFAKPLQQGDVVGLRVGSVGVAVRVLYAEGFGDKPAELVLQADPVGLKYGALRLTAYHAKGALPRGGAARAETLILVDHCADDSAYAALQKRAADAQVNDAGSDSDWWQSTATLGRLTLSVRYDRHTRKPFERVVNGKLLDSPTLLTVDGREIGEMCLPAQ